MTQAPGPHDPGNPPPDPLPHNHRRARRPVGPARLRRSARHRTLAGVLGGIAEFVGADPMWLRLLFVLSVPLTGGMTLIAYLILWPLLPPSEEAPGA